MNSKVLTFAGFPSRWKTTCGTSCHCFQGTNRNWLKIRFSQSLPQERVCNKYFFFVYFLHQIVKWKLQTVNVVFFRSGTVQPNSTRVLPRAVSINFGVRRKMKICLEARIMEAANHMVCRNFISLNVASGFPQKCTQKPYWSFPNYANLKDIGNKNKFLLEFLNQSWSSILTLYVP